MNNQSSFLRSWEYSSMEEWSGRYRYTGSIPVIPTKYTNTLLGIIRGRKVVLVVADKRNSAINPKYNNIYINKTKEVFLRNNERNRSLKRRA